MFRALAVFRGSFSREAAEAVGGASLSSLSALDGDLPRFNACPTREVRPVITSTSWSASSRSSAWRRSTRARRRTARQQHLDYFVSLVERAEEAWDTAREAEWLDRLRTEQPNLDAALRWAMEQQQTEKALRLSAGLFTFWVYTSPAVAVRGRAGACRVLALGHEVAGHHARPGESVECRGICSGRSGRTSSAGADEVRRGV
ncbi:MAG: hypothetical protein WKF73_10670 [Nocardioidaceae bacterium]